MTPSKPSILTVDDDPDLRALVALHVRRWGYRSDVAQSAAALWAYLDRDGPPEVILLDVLLGDADGSQLIQELRRRQPGLPVIMITRSTSVEAAVRCMKHGASDYITKPLDFERLRRAVALALEVGRLSQGEEAAEEPGPCDANHGLVGKSAVMRQLYGRLERLAPAEVSVLILGETGTGKELVARAIHRASRRHAGPFIAVNAAALPHELIESVLFGHEKGAFTGAQQSHIGYCEQADGGTLFLDEIGEMSFEMQAKLLRFLQDHVVQRLGSRQHRRVDVRVVAATNVDPRRQIAERKLREDLYYRLRVVSLELPPLRMRDGDIARLAQHFLTVAAERHRRGFRRCSDTALGLLERYSWPGNVRELENVVEEAVVLHDGEELGGEMLPVEVVCGAPGATLLGMEGGAPPTHTSFSARELAEKRNLASALERTAGRPEAAASELGISRATVYRRIKKYGL